MSKQVKAASAAPLTAPAVNGNSRNNLYMSVDTFDTTGRTIGARIVDLYHFGTRGWLQQHFWWAMHNGHTVEVNVATDEQIATYIAAGTTKLAEKYGGTEPVVEAAAPETPQEVAA